MGGKRGVREARHRHRGPDLPNRTQSRDSFHQNIPYPSGSEEAFAHHHADIYANEEPMVDGRHVGSPHFPHRSDRARMHGVYTVSNQQRDRTRDAYGAELRAAVAEFDGLDDEQAEYYAFTSDSF